MARADNTKEQLVLMCKECGDEQREYFQEILKKIGLKPNELIGKHIKKEFRGGERQREHMWVKITDMTEEEDLVGVLANNPCVVKNLQYGDLVTVKMNEIEDIDY